MSDNNINLSKEPVDDLPPITVSYAGDVHRIPFQEGKTVKYYLEQAGIGTGLFGTGLGSGKTVSINDNYTKPAKMTTEVPVGASIQVNTRVRNG